MTFAVGWTFSYKQNIKMQGHNDLRGYRYDWFLSQSDQILKHSLFTGLDETLAWKWNWPNIGLDLVTFLVQIRPQYWPWFSDTFGTKCPTIMPRIRTGIVQSELLFSPRGTRLNYFKTKMSQSAFRASGRRCLSAPGRNCEAGTKT